MKEQRLLLTPIWDEYVNDTPERNLLVAVMASAIHDLRCAHPGYKKRAVEFFFPSNLKEAGLFTFEYCCEELDLDPKDIINAILTNPDFNPIKMQRVSSYKKRKKWTKRT